jgi:hypothetical protein
MVVHAVPQMLAHGEHDSFRSMIAIGDEFARTARDMVAMVLVHVR